MAGSLVIDTLKSSTTGAPVFQNTSGVEIGQLCKAWVNFAGSTGTRNASFNVSSVTRNGVGDYTINFANAMPDANYAPVIASQLDQSGGAGNATMGSGIYRTAAALSTGSFRMYAAYSTSGGQAQADMTVLSVAIFR